MRSRLIMTDFQRGVSVTKQGTGHKATNTPCTVFRARNNDAKGSEDEFVALKEYHVPKHKEEEKQAILQDVLAEFVSLFDDLTAIRKEHAAALDPVLVPYLGCDYAQGQLNNENRFLLIQPYLATTDWLPIASLAKQGTKLTEAHLKLAAKGLLRAVAALHEQGLTHDDMKPTNIFIKVDGDMKPAVDSDVDVRLSDYCIFKPIQKIWNPDAGNASCAQLPHYTAPEVFTDGANYDFEKADMWTLGCSLLMALSGKMPWSEHGKGGNVMFKIINSKEGHPMLPDGLSEDCAKFMKAFFVRDFSRRPSAAEMLTHPFLA